MAPWPADYGPLALSRSLGVTLRKYLNARRARERMFGGQWFADPVWDILLDLLASHHEGRTVTIGDACLASAVPATTALRHIHALIAAGHVVRQGDAHDLRRILLTLSPSTSAQLDRWAYDNLKLGLMASA